MERICKTCEATFEPTFGRQINCGECKQKKTAYKQAERAKQAEQAGKFQDVDDYVMPDTQRTHLDQIASETVQKVRAELPTVKLTTSDLYVIESCSECLVGLEHNYTKRVMFNRSDVQMLVAGHLVDAVASTAVERVHRAPHLLLSTTFAEMYRKFLPMVVDWASKNRQYASDDLIRDVREGLAGTYIPKLKYTPAAPPPDVPEVPADEPSEKQVLTRNRVRLTRPLYPYLSSEAQRYLDGN